MLYLGIDMHPAYTAADTPSFPQHTLFTTRLSKLDLPSHQSSHGLITTLYGAMNMKINGVTQTIDDSVFMIVNRGSSVSATIKDQQCQPFFLYFRGAMGLSGEDWNIAERMYEATTPLRERIRTLASLTDSCSSFISMQSDAIVRSTLAEIVLFTDSSTKQSMQLNLKKGTTRQDNYKKLVAARDWIENNFTQSLSLHQLATMASMNDQHFLRRFKTLFNKTPHQYLIDRRIEEAQKHLRSKDLSVQEICVAIGWESVATFSHLFKQRTGSTPGQYRSQSGSDNIL
jgi:AraC family transcriptional regulator